MSRMVHLEDVAMEVTVGHVGSMSDQYVDDGVPFLRSLNVLPHRIDVSEVKYIPPTFHAKLKKSALKPGDVVIVRTGKPGTCAVIPDALPDANCSDLVIVRCGPELRPRFLAYWVNTIASEHVAAHIVGAVQQHFNVGAAKRMPIKLPSVAGQDAILGVLGALDDKIELNRKMAATLEDMARALYRSWFVDFDPVVAKCEGRSPVHMSADTAALFPDRFGDDGLPVGWTIKKLGELIDRLKVGKLYNRKSVAPEGAIPVLDQGKSGIIGFHDNAPNIIASRSHRVSVFANHTCVQHLLDYPFSTIQNVIPFVGRELPTEWCHYASLGRQKFEEYRGHWPSFVEAEIVVPTINVTCAFVSFIDDWLSMMSEKEIENRTLVSMRDTLLPQLMSGKLRIQLAQEIVEDAV